MKTSELQQTPSGGSDHRLVRGWWLNGWHRRLRKLNALRKSDLKVYLMLTGIEETPEGVRSKCLRASQKYHTATVRFYSPNANVEAPKPKR